MRLRVTVTTRGERPADGTPVVIEVRDTSLMDVAAVSVASVVTGVGEIEGEGLPDPASLASAQLEVPDELVEAGALTVFVHVQAGSTQEVTAGDLLTVQSYPVTPEAADLAVEVVRIG